MRIVGIQFGSHDAGAALVIDGAIVAAESEERITRHKKDQRFPFGAIADVLKLGNLEAKDVDAVAIAGTGTLWTGHFDTLFQRQLTLRHSSMLKRLLSFFIGRWFRPLINGRRLRKELRGLGLTAPLVFFDHHLCHAASAYYTMGAEDPLTITIDGEGDGLCATVSIAENGNLRTIKRIPWYRSPGHFYSSITRQLGMRPIQHEGKVTGLAAYGNPATYREVMQQLIAYDPAKDRFFWPFLKGQWFDSFLLHTHLVWKGSIVRKYFSRALPAVTAKDNFRAAADIAAAAQERLEEVVCSFTRAQIEKTGKRQLALAGGVFANVKLNQRIAELHGVDELYIAPPMGDDGLALGAALVMAARAGEARTEPLLSVYLGPAFTDAEIRQALARYPVRYGKPNNIEALAADALAQGEAVALFQGRMEYGPRALGNRSVIASPKDPSINQWLNQKFERTEYMPFAPVTLVEYAGECYTGLTKGRAAARFMTLCTPCTDAMSRTQPAVVHVDGTARPQLIEEAENPRYFRILKQFQERTGLPSMINTSFNMHEEPIVRSPDDALRAFLASNLPHLILEDYWVEPNSV